MRGWPLPRPTHAPATTLKTNGNSAPTTPRAVTLWRHACLTTPVVKLPATAPNPTAKESPSDTGATSKEKNNIVIPEFSAWLTLVLERCRAENIRNLPRKRAPTPLFPERRPREACSMPISGCHDLPLATFNLPSRNNLQNKPNSAATMSLPCSRFATAQPQRRWDAPPGNEQPQKNPPRQSLICSCFRR